LLWLYALAPKKLSVIFQLKNIFIAVSIKGSLLLLYALAPREHSVIFQLDIFIAVSIKGSLLWLYALAPQKHSVIFQLNISIAVYTKAASYCYTPWPINNKHSLLYYIILYCTCHAYIRIGTNCT
jgi:hypothetical protein